MDTFPVEERKMIPMDMDAERRIQELKIICKAIVLRLPLEEQKLLREYGSLLQQKADAEVFTAYQSGIQVGQRRIGR